jgi:hypothetical protein
MSRFHVLRSRTHFLRYQGVGSHFHVFRFRTHIRRHRGRRVPFSCFVLPNSFSAVPRALRARNRFRRYRGRRVPFSCFARPDSFSAVSKTWGPVFMFCAPRLIFVGAEGVGSRFHLLRARLRFRRCRGRRVPFSCFVRQNSFSTVSRASGPVFLFFTPGLVFVCTEGVGSGFHVLHARIRFRRYRGRRVPFSYFAL